MTLSEPDGREDDQGSPSPSPSPWPRVLIAVVLAATSMLALLPQAGSGGAELRPLALGLVGLGVVAWLADRRRRQATPDRSR